MVCQDRLANTSFQVSIINEIPLIEMPKSIGNSESMLLQDSLKKLCGTKPPRIILDFNQTIFIDSNNSDLLLNSFKKINEQGIEIVVWSLHKPIMKAIINMGINHLVSLDLETNINLPPSIYHPSINEPISPWKKFKYYSDEIKLFFEKMIM